MRHTVKRRIVLALVLLSVLEAIVSANGPSYTAEWWTVDGGGETVSSDGYTLSGTIGQPDVATWRGGKYALSGGFWVGGDLVDYTVYLPLVVRE